MQHDIQDFWMNDVNSCLRRNNLVYVNHPKCASTYYMNLLAENGWTPLEYKDIDWASDHVFGFFMDPFTKHAKAITAELAGYPDKLDVLLSMGPRFFQDLGLFGWHTMPLWLRFGNRVWDITWIPIDVQIDSDTLFRKFLKHHNTEIDFVSVDSNPSDAYTQQLFHQIKQLIGNGSAILWQVLSRDLDLYNQIGNLMNYQGHCWSDVYRYQPGIGK